MSTLNEEESAKTNMTTTESDSDDDIPKLSKDTMAVLEQFLSEKKAKENEVQCVTQHENIEENWQLSQFWYTDETAEKLANEAIRISGNDGCIACVCCPTVYKKLAFNKPPNCTIHLFEFDDRFSMFQEGYVHYDYKNPLLLNPEFMEKFDVVIADPPFLSKECLSKVAETIKFLSKGKIILCTGAVMEDLVEEILSLHRCQFEPHHVHALGNPFYCYSNYNLDDHINSD